MLHMLAAAKQKLLTKDAILVPAAATVFCQPLQMRVGQASTVSSLSPKPFPLLPFVSAVPSLPFPLCLSLSAFPSLPFPLYHFHLVVPLMLLLSSHADAGSSGAQQKAAGLHAHLYFSHMFKECNVWHQSDDSMHRSQDSTRSRSTAGSGALTMKAWIWPAAGMGIGFLLGLSQLCARGMNPVCDEICKM